MARHRGAGWLRKLLFADRYVRIPGVTARRRLMEMTDGLTGTAHRVTDHAFAMGRRAGGRYVAVCGLQILPASLTASERGHCPTCEWDSQLAQNARGHDPRTR